MDTLFFENSTHFVVVCSSPANAGPLLRVSSYIFCLPCYLIIACGYCTELLCNLLLGAQGQQLSEEQDQLPCGPKGTSSGSSQERVTHMVQAHYMLRKLLQHHPSRHFGGWAMLWSTEEMLDQKYQRVDIPAHTGVAGCGFPGLSSLLCCGCPVGLVCCGTLVSLGAPFGLFPSGLLSGLMLNAFGNNLECLLSVSFGLCGSVLSLL